MVDQQKAKCCMMSSSRFELETLSVLDSRDNRLHHDDCSRVSGFFSIL